MSNSEEPSRTVLYARVSTDQQAGRDHFSIAAQFNEMREYAQRRGWQVAGEFVDEGLSGEQWDRPALETILEMASQGNFDILLVHELSRLSRSVYHTLDIFEVLGQHNMGFASVKDPDFDFADPTKRLFLVILAAINQYYVDILRMHIRKSKRQRARVGLYNAAVLPYGYRLAGTPKNPPVIVPEEAEVVKLAYEQYATGKVSHMEIAEMLNAQGHRTRPVSDAVKGRQFSKDTISGILRNQFYMGKVVYKGRSQSETEVFDGKHESIITSDLWEVVQKAHSQRRSGSRSMQKTFRVYLLSWLARCDVCGRKLRCQATSKEYTYYREVSLERGFQDCPHTRLSTRTEPVDQYIHAIIAEVGLPKEWLEEVVERLTAESELDGMQRKRKSLENRRRRLKEMKIAGEFDEDVDLYYREMKRVQRELARIPSQAEIEGLKDATATLQDLPEIWAKSDDADQRDLLRSMVKAVGVDVPLGRVVSITPQPVFRQIFRAVPLLDEREPGVFVPIWGPEYANREAHEQVINIPQLPALQKLTDAPVALPFLMENPLAPSARSRIAPGISMALMMGRKAGTEPKKVIQISAPDRQAFPVDLRKWSQATAEGCSLMEVMEMEKGSVDVLATQFLLWDNAIIDSPENMDDILARIYDLLRKNGVWYLQDLLPIDMPPHWIFQFFPAAWEWVRNHTWNLYTLYNQMRAAGFAVKVNRQAYYQPINIKTALGIAKKRAGVLAALPDDDFEMGIDRLQCVLDKQNSDKLVGSEVALVEMWGQKEVD